MPTHQTASCYCRDSIDLVPKEECLVEAKLCNDGEGLAHRIVELDIAKISSLQFDDGMQNFFQQRL